ncbi:segregation/condensation protein A [Haloglomus litoreum]|uniref:segregation/condensation protein A n=1 Tax=Haloglomus litoreum TaxID=3034026 RepID=UPI0023E76039|nr:segregation/condensation protein A [Haloglomus sp. DT116]
MSDDDDIPLNIAGHEDRTRPGEGDGGEDGHDAAEPDGSAEPGEPSVDVPGLGPDDHDDGEPDTGFAGFSVADEVEAVDESDVGDDDAVEPVELLVQLADEDRIDPWDIDIVTVTDAFLDRLDGADLRTGGRALFYASVLLRMKSDAMLTDDEDDAWEEDPREPWEVAWEDGPADPEGAAGDPSVDPIAGLEEEMERRLERKNARGMPQTLDQLVRELRERERESRWKESRTYDTSGSPSGYSRGTQTLDYRAGDDFRMDEEPTVDDVTGTAHDEHMEDVITDVYTALREQYDQGRAEVLFTEVREAGGSTVQTFLGLLFLAHRGQVRLEQDETFGDLWVQDPAAVEGTEEAVAD